MTKEGKCCNAIKESYHDGKVATNDVWSSAGNKSERLKEPTSQVFQINLLNFLVACGKLAVKAVPASWKTSCTMPNPQPNLSNSHLHSHNCINVFALIDKSHTQ